MGSLEIDVRVEILFSRFPSVPVWFTCYLLVFWLFSYVFLASFMILLAVSGCVCQVKVTWWNFLGGEVNYRVCIAQTILNFNLTFMSEHRVDSHPSPNNLP